MTSIPGSGATGSGARWWWFAVFLWGLTGIGSAQRAKVLSIENTVLTSRQRSSWKPSKIGEQLVAQDRIRTGRDSRATVRLTDLYTMRLDSRTAIAITPGLIAGRKPQLNVIRGVTLLLSREPEGGIEIRTPTVNAALRGTQLLVEVGEDGRTVVRVLEGRVDLSNAKGELRLRAGEAGEALPGEAPRRTPAIQARNLLQWALYYPAVLDPAELDLNVHQRARVSSSLKAYQSGDLLRALELYPDFQPVSDSGQLYKAGVLLAVGQVDRAESLLRKTPRDDPRRRALERMIAAVRGPPLRESPAGDGHPSTPAATPDRELATSLRVGPEFQSVPGSERRVAGRESRSPDEWDLANLQTASEALAESYFQQARWNLAGARAAAIRATELSPSNGFAWARRADVEFSYGHNSAATSALETALNLTPLNAQAHALRGFLLAGRNRLDEALRSFETARGIDGGLPNAWLGRGLVRIRQGHLVEGRQDLQVAATVAPTTSFFQSYLGRAFLEEGKGDLARQSLDLARSQDPNDPTPWLYSALAHQRGNQPNRAVADLEESIRRNDNRLLYRSQNLVDQDQAFRRANLAAMYQDAGMPDAAVRVASLAVANDYKNPFAHRFLANSFDALRDPNRFALRYETAWFNELLLSNLLAPAGAGSLASFLTQQEYSKMFSKDGWEGWFENEWRSSSEFRSEGSIILNEGNVSVGIDTVYREDPGDRTNSASTLRETVAQLKWQVGSSDQFYLMGKWLDLDSGDNFQTYDNQPRVPGLDFEEHQVPGLALAGWNHKWSDQSCTLFLGGVLRAEQRLRAPQLQSPLLTRDSGALVPGFVTTHPNRFDEFTDPALQGAFPLGVPVGSDRESLLYSPDLLRGIAPVLGTGDVNAIDVGVFDFDTHQEFETYTAELQQIFNWNDHTVLLGGRVQDGEFRTKARLAVERPTFLGGFSTPAADQDVRWDFERISLYAYDYWKLGTSLHLMGGLTWDHLTHPINFRNPPVSEGTETDQRLSGKFGFIYLQPDLFTLRGMFAEGLGGVSFDESVRLEPVQLAGFTQAYRTVISESLVGSVEAPEFTNWALSIENPPRGPTSSLPKWAISVNVVEQEVDRIIGAFDGYFSGVFQRNPAYFPSGTPQRLDYREQQFAAVVSRPLNNDWTLAGGYRLTHSELKQTLPELVALAPWADREDSATLHELFLNATWNSPTGCFARAGVHWYKQDLDDDAVESPMSGDEFLHLDAWLGYSFDKQQARISAGILNLTDTDYRLSPLTPYGDLPRERTFVLNCRWSF